MRQTFSTDLRNAPGVLARVEGVFRRLDVALESLVLAPSADAPPRHCLTIVVDVSPEQAGFLTRRLRRLVDVKPDDSAADGMVWQPLTSNTNTNADATRNPSRTD